MTASYAWYDTARKYDYGRKADDNDGYGYGYAYGGSTYGYGDGDDEEYGTGLHYGNIWFDWLIDLFIYWVWQPEAGLQRIHTDIHAVKN